MSANLVEELIKLNEELLSELQKHVPGKLLTSGIYFGRLARLKRAYAFELAIKDTSNVWGKYGPSLLYPQIKIALAKNRIREVNYAIDYKNFEV